MTITSDVQKLYPGDLVDLFILDLNPIGVSQTFRFHAMHSFGTGSVYWQGEEYISFPVEVEGFELSGDQQLPTPKVRVANVTGMISSLLTEMDDLVGAKVVRKRTLAKYLDKESFPSGENPDADPAQHFADEIWFIDRKATETKTVVEFELCVPWDLQGVKIPARPCNAVICCWRYRGDGCGYIGSPVATNKDVATTDPTLDDCSRRLTGCQLRFGLGNPLPIGVFPAVGIIR